VPSMSHTLEVTTDSPDPSDPFWHNDF